MSDPVLMALNELKEGQTRIQQNLDRVEKNLSTKIEGVGAQVRDLDETVARFMGSFKEHRDWSTRNVNRIAEASEVDLSDDPPPKVATG